MGGDDAIHLELGLAEKIEFVIQFFDPLLQRVLRFNAAFQPAVEKILHFPAEAPCQNQACVNVTFRA